MLDQPVFEVDYVEKRSRLTTFFRLILAIPHVIVAYVWSLLAGVAVIIAWFAIVITGRYPESLYGFVAASQRYVSAVYGYFALLTDEYPPFGSDTDDFPINLRIPPRKESYNRVKTLFRIILAIPVMIIGYAMQIVWEVGAFLAWFVIVVIGKQPKGLQDMIALGLSYQQRSYCYFGLLTEDWPSFTNPEGGAIDGPSGGSGLPPAPATSPAPVAPEAPGSLPGLPSDPPRGGGLSGGDPLNG